ncbi:Ribosomal protein L11 methyltransferase (PrmA), partial [Candidatus Electrothrix communis]
MDPGMAFGTGQHASTKLALGLISSCFDSRGERKYWMSGQGQVSWLWGQLSP